jgi:hypothetical protein
MKKCLAGPFIGEFGWELFCWQGFLRKRRPQYDSMIVICRKGHSVLYQDFADEIIEIEIPGNNLNMWKGGIAVEPIISYYNQLEQFTDFIPFDTYKTRWWLEPNQQTFQTFIPYGHKSMLACDILMHVRNAFHCRTTFRNWKKDSAQAYAEWAITEGFSVACIGRGQTALHIAGTLDLRDMHLSRLVDVMASSRVIIGSQSGPHHLASLCQLPVIAWQTKPEHVDRLSKYWNPFNVRTCTNTTDISYWKERKHWQPPLEWMKEATVEILRRDRDGSMLK